MKIHTILGSCIAVCLYDKVKKAGGMNHFMLPYWNGTGLATPKYGNIAIERLLDGMLRIGCKQENLVAKVFGGSAVLNVQSNAFSIGDRNSEAALDLLGEYKIPIIAKSIGGTLGRKIIYDTYTSEVIHRIIKN
ncbi:MAG: chemotaxis protein CheD [Bacteroidales bacterium]|nr:chemotaxis protein CheD [Bacteroidales bacterium]